MPNTQALLSGDPQSPPSTKEERLERGDILPYEPLPFPMPEADDLDFLRDQRLRSLAHKNISYNPVSGDVAGYVPTGGDEQEERLRAIFRQFSEAAFEWVKCELPGYADGIEKDRVSFRPVEEATRRIRVTARNDLLHIDAFPNRPSHGRRILRVFVNIHPSEPRIWLTSYPFDELLSRYGSGLGYSSFESPTWFQHLRHTVSKLLHIPGGDRSPYDEFMIQFHNFLKRCDHLQEHGPKRLWAFPSMGAWLSMPDGFAHAVTRGQYALEHSFFVATEVLACPDLAPKSILDSHRRARISLEHRAA